MSKQPLAVIKANLLHEALQRAVKIAPTKGAGFDKAAGLFFSLRPGEVWMRATDLERTFFAKIPAEVVTPSPMSFRVTSNISKFIASLPMGGDQDIRISLDTTMKRIVFQYMKSPTKIAVPEISGEYPIIDWFDYNEMDDAFELAGKLQSVAWAIEDSAVAPINGVRIDGEWIEAVCSKQMARIRCKVSASEPIVAVVKTLAPIIAMGSRVKIKAGDGRVIVALDELCQVTSFTVLGGWPNLTERLEKIDLPYGFTIGRVRLQEALGRILGFTAGDRFPRITFDIGADRVTMGLLEAKDGDITDVVGLSDRIGDEPVQFVFNPAWLLKAVETFPGSEIKVQYVNALKPIRLLEPMTSYNALIMGLNPGEKVESPKEDS